MMTIAERAEEDRMGPSAFARFRRTRRTGGVLLPGEVAINRDELARLRADAQAGADYKAAVKSRRMEEIRQRAMMMARRHAVAPRRLVFGFEQSWGQGILEYEQELGEALLDEMRKRGSL